MKAKSVSIFLCGVLVTLLLEWSAEKNVLQHISSYVTPQSNIEMVQLPVDINIALVGAKAVSEIPVSSVQPAKMQTPTYTVTRVAVITAPGKTFSDLYLMLRPYFKGDRVYGGKLYGTGYQKYCTEWAKLEGLKSCAHANHFTRDTFRLPIHGTLANHPALKRKVAKYVISSQEGTVPETVKVADTTYVRDAGVCAHVDVYVVQGKIEVMPLKSIALNTGDGFERVYKNTLLAQLKNTEYGTGVGTPGYETLRFLRNKADGITSEQHERTFPKRTMQVPIAGTMGENYMPTTYLIYSTDEQPLANEVIIDQVTYVRLKGYVFEKKTT